MDRVYNSTSWSFATESHGRTTKDEGPGPYRAPAELEEEQRAHQRRLGLAQQCSELNPPDVRIRAWEKVHGLRLPADLAHPILEVIAVGTRLTLAEIHAEQRARATRSGERVKPHGEASSQGSNLTIEMRSPAEPTDPAPQRAS